MRKMASKTPRKPIPRPKNRFQARIYNLVNERAFEISVMFAILANMVVMAMDHYNMDEDMHEVLEFINNGVDLKNLESCYFAGLSRLRSLDRNLSKFKTFLS